MKSKEFTSIPDDTIQKDYALKANILLSNCCNAETTLHKNEFHCIKCKKICQIKN